MFRPIKFPISTPILWRRKPLYLGIAIVLGAAILIASNTDRIANRLPSLFRSMPWESLGGALLIFGLRLADVPIGTLKTVIMVRGMRTSATLLGLLEVTIWITAMGRVMDQLDNPWNIAGYALGYSAGTWLGMWIENRLAFGWVQIHAISLSRNNEIAEIIRAAGYGVTQFQGYGQSGPLCIVGTIVERKHLNDLLKSMRAVDATVFITVDDTRQVVGGRQPDK